MGEYIDSIAVFDDVWLVWYENDEPAKRLLNDEEKRQRERLQIRHRDQLEKLLFGFRDGAA